MSCNNTDLNMKTTVLSTMSMVEKVQNRAECLSEVIKALAHQQEGVRRFISISGLQRMLYLVTSRLVAAQECWSHGTTSPLRFA